jgi:small subunit ribosomal protein S20
MRQNLVRRQRNLKRKEALKWAIKRLKKAIAAGDRAKAQELVPQLMKAADKAAKRRVIHPNKAARIKSRLMRRLQALSRS